jgi:hypothetical protein
MKNGIVRIYFSQHIPIIEKKTIDLCKPVVLSQAIGNS